ncbi:MULTISPECIES: MarR family winged helix-turn-helix transcriptional regulator [Arthrobacter]|uniref:MarR family winged helix-turn-helix transcriptional regulator n=1 Tax=unclassified Arthrobacter TaxID=235627 RepID=UPI0024B9D773|nr:MarR family transcriptional regulator [Arthrobacter sp. H35-MC1]MDJ0317487.1 MarR family transcriptional regulator [Arthrobacter sp. H35-MC1]
MVPASPLPIDPIAEAKRQWIAHGWTDAADAMAAYSSVMRAHQLMYSRVDAALKPLGLSYARLELLRLLSFTRDGALPMTSASARLQVHPTSVTSVVHRLEKDALVRREAHPTDGRATLVIVTGAGRLLAEEATAALNSGVFADPGIPAADLQVLTQILARFRRASGDFIDPVQYPDPL